MKVKILIENTYNQEKRDEQAEIMNKQPELISEHGLSMLIEYNNRKILLDAGSTSAFMDNAKLMGVDIEADFCVLSHGHYDHSGGFAEYLSKHPEKKVYAMKEIVDDYYSGSGGSIHPIGVPKNVYPAYKDNFVLLEGSTKLDEGIYIVAHNNTDNNTNGNNDISKNIENVDKSNDYAKIGERGKLYKKLDDRYVPDDFGHEKQLDFFEQIITSVMPAGIHLSYRFDETIHDREIVTDTGWKIILGRGLDIFQNYDGNNTFALQNSLQEYRSCKSFGITYVRAK